MWQAIMVADPALSSQELRHRGAAGQAAPAIHQAMVDRTPGFSRRCAHRPRSLLGPGAGLATMCIGPTQDSLHGKPRQSSYVADTTVFSQQLGQRPASRQAAGSLVQGSMDTAPGFSGRLRNRARGGDWPAAGTPPMRVGPAQDARNRTGCACRAVAPASEQVTTDPAGHASPYAVPDRC
jgi:hypothetical protein